MATPDTWNKSLDFNPEKPGAYKTWALKNLGSCKPGFLKNLDPEKVRTWKTCAMKNLKSEKAGP